MRSNRECTLALAFVMKVLGHRTPFYIPSFQKFERKDRSPSTSSLSSLRTADMMQFQRGLAALDDQIAKLRDSLHLNS